MPRRPQRSVPTVLVPGWHGSPAGHWQAWLDGELTAAGREVRRPGFASFDEPDLTDWLAALRRCLDGLPAAGFDVVAHSLGAVLWLHHVIDPADTPRPARVAPRLARRRRAPRWRRWPRFFPPPIDVDAVRHGAEGTVLVAGDDDPYLPEGRTAAAYGLPLKIATTVIEGGGHLNPESGFGEWRGGARLVRARQPRLLLTAATARSAPLRRSRRRAAPRDGRARTTAASRAGRRGNRALRARCG